VRVLRAVGCVAVLVTGIALTPVVRGLGARRRERLTRIWSRTLLRSLGVRVRIVGGDGGHDGAALVVSNHVSWIDIPLIATVRPSRMLAKTEVGRWPVLGPVAAWGGTIFLDRDRLRALPGTVAEIASVLRGGGRVVVFPEGSTWCGRAAGRFRPALFQAAIDSGAPVQPMTITYRLADGRATTTPAFVGEDGLVSSLGRVIAMRGLEAEIVLRPVIRTDEGLDRRALALAARDAAVGRCGHVPAQARAEAGVHAHA
jgi:1-acyl-sn-glycerol-3-phosphate acyltransferase